MTTSERRASGAPSESTGETTTPSVEAPPAPGAEPIDVLGGQVVGVASHDGTLLDTHLGDYLKAVFGETEGTAFVAVGSDPYVHNGRYKHGGWEELSFTWPGESAALERAVTRGVQSGADVYVCPYLMEGRKRAKGAAVERTRIHAHIDGVMALGRVEDLGGYAVASGTAGHGHVYVDLDGSVPGPWHEALCRGLGVYMGDADAKVSDNDLLRPPTTLNHKPVAFGTGSAAGVEWLVRPPGYRWDPQDLAETLDVSLPPPIGSALTPVRRAVVQPDTPNLPQRVTDAMAEVSQDRSADTMRVVAACVGEGFTLERTRAAVAQRPDLAERLGERKDDDVLRCWTRASDSRAKRSPGRGPTAGPGAAVIPLPVAAGQQRASDPDAVHRGQTRMAYRLAQSHGHRLMHVYGLGWHVWDSRRWIEDDRGAAKRAVLDVLRTALSESLGDHDLQSDVRKCESASGIAGVLDIAAALEAFAVTVQDLDPDP